LNEGQKAKLETAKAAASAADPAEKPRQ